MVAECCFLLQRKPKGVALFCKAIMDGLIKIDISLKTQFESVVKLMHRYENVSMSLAAACLVRMSELNKNSVIFTLDKDFEVYRRFSRQQIPVLMP